MRIARACIEYTLVEVLVLAADRLAALDGPWKANAAWAGAADSVHATLREAIVSGQLHVGDKLVEERIARQFGVSRTPVREAIMKLEAEHLVIRIPRRGLVVRSLSEEEVLQVYTVRTALDSLAARLAASEARPAERAELRWLNDSLREVTRQCDAFKAAELSTRFHEALAQATHNDMLVHFVRQINDRVRRLGEVTLGPPERSLASVAEHDRLLDALDARDPEAAEQIARAHSSNAHQALVASLLNRRDRTD